MIKRCAVLISIAVFLPILFSGCWVRWDRENSLIKALVLDIEDATIYFQSMEIFSEDMENQPYDMAVTVRNSTEITAMDSGEISLSDIEVGSYIHITYYGIDRESNPMQIEECHSIHVIDQTEKMTAVVEEVKELYICVQTENYSGEVIEGQPYDMTVSVNETTKVVDDNGKISHNELQKGQTVEITYSGGIAESYPAQIFKCHRIQILEE